MTGAQKHYRLVEGTVEELERKVHALLEKGWTLDGLPICHAPGMLVQKMTYMADWYWDTVCLDCGCNFNGEFNGERYTHCLMTSDHKNIVKRSAE